MESDKITSSKEEERPIVPMNSNDFRHWGKYMVDYICEYLDTLPERKVIPDVEPGYLASLLPKNAPEKPEDWNTIFEDVNNCIMPGITHWQHPRFHAYFPAGNSFPSIMGDMLADALGTIGFSWAACPAMTELEILVTDWLAKLMNLPDKFTHEGTGGGALQSSASDSILLSLLAARHQTIEERRGIFDEAGDPNAEYSVLSRMVGYASCLAHSSVEKAGMIAFVRMRAIDVKEDYSMDEECLRNAIEEDLAHGMIPFYVCCTMGSTACCSFDPLDEVGKIAKEYNMWLHIDGAYGGNSFICPEFQHHLKGVEHASSMNFNPNKWLLTNFDCSVLWVSDKDALTRSMVVNPVYLQHKYSNKALDLRHWGIPLSRRFRSLKLWFVIRSYGAEGLRSYIRNHVTLAKKFEALVEKDKRFEVVGKVITGLVCFRIKGENSLTQCLLRSINESRELHMVPAMVNEKYVIRFAVCREDANEKDIDRAWEIIKTYAMEILTAELSLKQWKAHTLAKTDKRKKRAEILENMDIGLEMLPGDINESVCSDLDFHQPLDFPLDDEELGALALSRLRSLKTQENKEAFEVLAGQMKSMGLENIPTYEECPKNESDKQTVNKNLGKLVKTSTLNNVHAESSDSHHNSGIDMLAHNATSSKPPSPIATGKMRSQEQFDSDDKSSDSQRLSLNMSRDGRSSSNGSRVLARLTSMVLNASGNASILSSNSSGKEHRLRYAQTIDMPDGKVLSQRYSHSSQNLGTKPNMFMSMDNENLKSGIFPKSASDSADHSMRMRGYHSCFCGSYRCDDEDPNEVFSREDDLAVGTKQPQSTLTKLRRKTLLKMISDPQVYGDDDLCKSLSSSSTRNSSFKINTVKQKAICEETDEDSGRHTTSVDSHEDHNGMVEEPMHMRRIVSLKKEPKGIHVKGGAIPEEDENERV